LRDSGGVSEFVVDGINGIIASSDPIDLGIRITEVYTSGRSRVLGIAARRRIDELNINWDYVIESLLK
jgi:glycosyltransferase involved in cell wall biosynthesis